MLIKIIPHTWLWTLIHDRINTRLYLFLLKTKFSKIIENYLKNISLHGQKHGSREHSK